MTNDEQQLQEFEKTFTEVKAMLHLTDEIMIRLNTKFFETVRMTLEQLNEAIVAQDDDVIERYAHSIKGSAGSLRYTQISEIAENLEKSAHAKESDLYTEALSKLSEAFITAAHGYSLWKNKQGQN